MAITKEQITAALNIAVAVVAAIKESGQEGLPSGPLFATICGKVSYNDYIAIIEMLKNQRLLKQDNNVLYWIGDK